ncbi:4'-phosphopantetheinyl transferase [Dietzia sp. NCCP-2495]|uniref:4'-phosphopantetheinyl transferase family protein n=1 Tax=Dietzia sp. NCCP-2495 TaxID=2934675 RepID=UPI00222F55CC|nr:4'-phosphopantetheinyl transferase superfamily protein [Dietzia sp. NCCP-2495]GLB62364.1 4'-phosphopantetheinyl transferase [Dietzia sp. NCCP-2495]
MIHGIVPRDVVTVTDADLPMSDADVEAALYPAEAELIAKAVATRRADFAWARACAREAMTRLGVPAGPVVRGGRGMPVWPPGVVGTLTHTNGLRAAALGSADRVRSVGLDVEPHAPLADGVLGVVSLPEEAEWVRAVGAEMPSVHWDTLLFTAKEATYKAWYPLTRRWLGFEDAHITLVPDRDDDKGDDDTVVTGVLRSRILVDPSAADGGPDLVELVGRWVVRDGFVASAIVLRPAGVDTVES